MTRKWAWVINDLHFNLLAEYLCSATLYLGITESRNPIYEVETRHKCSRAFSHLETRASCLSKQINKA